MRTFVAAAAAIALLTAPANPQQMPGGGRQPHSDQQSDKDKDKAEKRKAAEKAYSDALAKIPNAKEPYDPWLGKR
jgi:hypothetical protein